MKKMEKILRVHIAVVGFEIDRISQAAIEQKADVVYLISKEVDEKGQKYFDENKRILEENKIVVTEKKVEDIHDLISIVKVMREIIHSEENNLIYINTSSGSIPAAIAGTIVATMVEKDYNVTLYYVKPETYFNSPEKDFGKPQPQTKGVKEIQRINIFPAKLPDARLTKVLLEIHNNEYLTKQKLIDFSIEKLDYKVETKGVYGPREYAWINKNIIEKLDAWEFITIQKVGKNSQISLTEKGKTMVEYLSD